MGNSISVTAPVHYTSARNIASYISGISSAATAIPTISTISITYPVQAKNFQPTASLELSRSLLSNDLPTIQTTRCTANCYAEGSDDDLKRSDEGEEELDKWIQVNGVGNPEQGDHTSKTTIWKSPMFPSTQEDVLTGSIKSATSSRIYRKLEEREVDTLSHTYTTVQVDIQAEPVFLAGSTSEGGNDPFTAFSPLPTTQSKPKIHSAEDLYGEEISLGVPGTEKVAVGQQNAPSPVQEDAALVQKDTGQNRQISPGKPRPPLPIKSSRVVYIPHKPMQLFGRPHRHHVQELMSTEVGLDD
jgi:hypothetical protein